MHCFWHRIRPNYFVVISAFCVTGVLAASDLPVIADGPSDIAQQFLEANCSDCHQGDGAEAGFDVEKLSGDLTDPEQVTRWVRVFDRVESGEMPPPEDFELAEDEQESFLATTGDWIRDHQLSQDREFGRVRGRRLTNLQLERTLQDLLGIRVPLATMMPEEPRRDGFIGVADAQPMSHYQMESHLEIVDAALDAAFEKADRDEPLHRREYTAHELCRKNPKRRCREPEWLDEAAVVWSSGMAFYGRIETTRARRSAWYRITFSASALNPPEDQGVWCTVRRGDCVSYSPLMAWIGAFEATDEAKEITFEAWIPEGQMLEIRPGDATIAKGRFRGGQVGAGEGEPQGVPGLALHGMKIEEIQPAGGQQRTQRLLFGDTDFRKKQDVAPESLARQLKQFARRAFRRRVSDAALQPYQQMLLRYLSEDVAPADALRMTYRAVLCSPRFLFLHEPVGELDEEAIASRLSYFLCQSLPDTRLRKLAKAGKLRDPEILIAETDRLLGTDRGRHFVNDFTDQWLELDQINFTEPDTKLYREFDLIVQDAMLRETRAFVSKLLTDNAPVQAVVSAPYTFLDGRLARYYDIPDVDGDSLRLVSLPSDSQRGGLLGHGSVLKVTANGTNTSPVLRGVWLCDRILGTPIPPPPENVPAIEPDVRGATTIREILMRHEEDPNCSACHRLIDPAGFALERFDAAGQWRDGYNKRGRKKSSKEAAIDASGELADGRRFEDFMDFRDLVAADPVPLATNLSEKLITFATGQPVRFADREAVDQIVRRTADSNYGVRDLLYSVITSDLFLNK